ncbi:nucleotidyltransferase family protein [Arundinibacter roseus]|uniref:Nucleotidyltransferase n=1 Tax=Arundinibacter roseus TaxID=2070510 RepID=A0A4R4KPQ5_9BACT|nr:nucleotidyltransferase family protein [Arundinibacter roseus]TDB68862.1 nucleotidyltransferase [Arundinibacter roseus]
MVVERQKIRARLAAIKPILAQRYPIDSLAFFGSVARNEATNTSDIDILVEFNKPIGFQFFSLAKDLEDYLQMPVDLVSRNGIKPAYFVAIEPDLIYV